MAGIQTLMKSRIWRVGDGTKIKIWKDEWIPRSPTKKVLTTRGNHLLSRVCDLIDPMTGDWDEQLVRQTFWQVDAQRILAIPLPLNDMTNFVAWNMTRTGVFTVRSGYHGVWESQYGYKFRIRWGPLNREIFGIPCGVYYARQK